MVSGFSIRFITDKTDSNWFILIESKSFSMYPADLRNEAYMGGRSSWNQINIDFNFLFYDSFNGVATLQLIQGSHISGLTKFHDISRFFKKKIPGIFSEYF